MTFHPGRASQLWPQAVGHLGRGVERQLVAVRRDRRVAVGLHRHDRTQLVDVAAAHVAVRWWTERPVPATSVTDSRSSGGSVATKAWLLPWSGKMTGAPGSRAAS